MNPVLEELTRSPQPAVQRLSVICAESREERQVVGPGDDIDRVELDHPDPGEHPSKVPHIDASAWSGVRETLGGERETARSINGQSLNCSGHVGGA
jgi:hypothetical protein